MSRRTPSRPLALFAALLGLATLAWALQDTPADPDVERARAAAKGLAKELKGRLEQELAAGGPLTAVRVCSEIAQTIAARHGAEGLAVRRVSARPRNLADQPDAWEATELARLAALQARGEPLGEVIARVEIGGEPYLRYLMPLTIAEPCLACHGDPGTFSPELRTFLSERYPEDRAVGYALNDLRGAVSVTLRTTRTGG